MNSVTIAPSAIVSPIETNPRKAVAAPAADSGSVATSGKSGLAYPNPSLRLDSQLGLVVIEFYDASGSVAQTIPNKQQLAAYRQWTETRHGENPLTGSPSPGAANGTAAGTAAAGGDAGTATGTAEPGATGSAASVGAPTPDASAPAAAQTVAAPSGATGAPTNSAPAPGADSPPAPGGASPEPAAH